MCLWLCLFPPCPEARAVAVQCWKKRIKDFSPVCVPNRDLLSVCNCLTGGCKGDRARLFPAAPRDGTRGCGHEQKHSRVPPNVRKHFFTMRVAEHKRLPTWVVGPLSLEAAKSQCSCSGRGLDWLTSSSPDLSQSVTLTARESQDNPPISETQNPRIPQYHIP